MNELQFIRIASSIGRLAREMKDAGVSLEGIIVTRDTRDALMVAAPLGQMKFDVKRGADAIAGVLIIEK